MNTILSIHVFQRCSLSLNFKVAKFYLGQGEVPMYIERSWMLNTRFYKIVNISWLGLIFNKLDLEKDQGQSWHHIESYLLSLESCMTEMYALLYNPQKLW